MASATCVAEGTGGERHMNMMVIGITAMVTNLLIVIFRQAVGVDGIYWMAFGCWAVIAICGAIKGAR